MSKSISSSCEANGYNDFFQKWIVFKLTNHTDQNNLIDNI